MITIIKTVLKNGKPSEKSIGANNFYTWYIQGTEVSLVKPKEDEYTVEFTTYNKLLEKGLS